MSEKNKAAAREELDVWSTGELDRLDGLVAPHAVHHDPYDPRASVGLEALKRTIALNREAFPDLEISADDQIAEGDKVATRWSATMTHRGDLPGAPATGHRTTLSGIAIERFEDGKVVESWRSMDMLRLLRSVGAVPAAAREEVVIKARHNGPYKVTGPVKLIDADGDEYDLSDKGEAVALCRCGGSTTKPFCDGTHSKVGFQAAERAVQESL